MTLLTGMITERYSTSPDYVKLPIFMCGLIQTTNRFDEECQRIRFEGGVVALRDFGPLAVKWLEELT